MKANKLFKELGYTIIKVICNDMEETTDIFYYSEIKDKYIHFDLIDKSILKHTKTCGNYISFKELTAINQKAKELEW